MVRAMKGVAALIALAVSLLLGTQTRVGEGERAAPAPQAADWAEWTRPLAPGIAPAAPAAAPAPEPPDAPEPEIDVVDAHWMALTMWGEARGGGEAAMRAVGHVIDNRRRAGLHGDFVTDTVGEAFQFSCWNPGDPNRAALDRVDSLSGDSADGRSWALARTLAAEILAGRSADPTGGALFYHTEEVAPRWSQGLTPVRRIGGHLFFLRAR